MPIFEIFDQPTLVDVDDTDTFQVALTVNGALVLLNPKDAVRIATAIKNAACEAEENMRQHIVDDKERRMAGDDPVSDHTGPNLTIIDGSNAFMRAVNRVAKPTDGGDAA